MGDSLKEFLVAELKGYLEQEDCVIPWLLAKFEAATGIKREHVVYTLFGVVATYLILGHGAELLCNFIGYAYPAYASFLALDTKNKDDDTQWLTYWTVFGTISLVDFASDKIMGYFPVYWLVKCVFLLWLYLPNFRGAEYLYIFHFEPAFRRMRQIAAAARGEQPEAQAPEDDTSQQVQSISAPAYIPEVNMPAPEEPAAEGENTEPTV